MTILITGGGFTGVDLMLDGLAQSEESAINFDKLETLTSLQGDMDEIELLATLNWQNSLKVPAMLYALLCGN